MSPIVVAGLTFSLLVIILIGGFITLFPITRRLGAYLEKKLEEKNEPGPDPGEVRELREAVGRIDRELRRLSERQDFVERLLEGRGSRAELEPGTRDGPDAG